MHDCRGNAYKPAFGTSTKHVPKYIVRVCGPVVQLLLCASQPYLAYAMLAHRVFLKWDWDGIYLGCTSRE